MLGVFARRVIRGNRVGSALLEGDARHRGASFIDLAELEAGEVFFIRGRDGVNKMLIQTKVEGGIAEYIVNDVGEVTHQGIIKGGKITGKENQRVRKGGK
jgi:hypothetical protein